MEYDIKFMLATSPAMRLQWKEIFNTLYPKYENEHKTKNSFSVTLHRKLKGLISHGDLKKEEKGHQQVFYFIPKKRRKEVVEEIEKASVLKKFDAFLDSFSSEQRKKLLQDSIVQQQLFISFLGRFSIEFLSSMQQLLEPWISKLENPTEGIKDKYSKEEREQFLIEIHELQRESENLKNDFVRDSQPISNEEFRKALNLTQEFMDKVVPKYSGGWREAIMDLMSESIKKVEKERKGGK
jgi:hypothetical protein